MKTRHYMVIILFIAALTPVLFSQNQFSTKEIYHFSSSCGDVKNILITDDNSNFVTISKSGCIKAYNLSNGKETNSLNTQGITPSDVIIIDNKILAVAFNDKIKFFQFPELIEKGIITLPASINKLAGTNSENNFYAGCSNGDVYLINPNENAFIQLFNSHSSEINSLSFSKENNLLVTAGKDGALKSWNTNKKSLVNNLIGNSNTVYTTLSISNDGQLLVTGSVDKMVRVWDLKEGKLIKNINEHSNDLTHVLFSPDASFFVSIGLDKSINFWNTNGYKLLKSIRNIKSNVNGTALSNNILLIAIDNEITAYEISSSFQTAENRSTTQPKGIQIEINQQGTTRALTINKESPVKLLTGKVTSQFKIKEFLINNEQVKLNSDGTFEYEIPTSYNEKIILIRAVDVKNNSAEKEFTLSTGLSSDVVEDKSNYDPSLGKVGKYYALFIGVEKYSDTKIPSLDNPIKDAQSLIDILSKNYSFDKENVKMLKNPTRSEILSELDNFRKKVGEEDNFLLFYAGHGYWDKEISQGYWLPSDAKKDNRANWISNGDLRDNIRGIKSRHTLLISDACFSGGIFKTRSLLKDAPPSINMVYSMNSRKGMTSGTLTEVADNSPFIKFLIKRLKENKDKYMTAESLFASIKTAIMNNSTQVPQYGEIYDAGDEGGDFVFIKK